ncbi:hypothetical protein N7490_003281 [Penicillium lividum]|nr:hypothetical protein N7490_003281 [Penicillium lividum]
MENTQTSDCKEENELAPPPESAVVLTEEQPQESEEAEPERRKVNLGIRYFNYRGFMNRVQQDNWDHTIECLLTTTNMRDTIDKERERRKRVDSSDESRPVEAAQSDPP